MPHWLFLKKNVLFGYFCARIIKKIIVIFEIRSLKFVYLQNFVKKQKCVNFERKKPILGILGPEFENNIVIFEISTIKFI